MTAISPEEGKTFATRFTEHLWDRGDMTVADQIIAANFLDHDPVPGQRPGLEGYKEMVSGFRSAFPDLRVKNEDVVVETTGNKVAMRWTGRGTNNGSLMNMPPTGKQVTLKGIDIIRIENGKAVERWGEFDALGMLQQLGVIPK